VHKTRVEKNQLHYQHWPILSKVLAITFFILLNLFLVNKVIANSHADFAEKTPAKVKFDARLQAELISMQQTIGKLHQQKFAFTDGRLPKSLIEQITKVSNDNSLNLLSVINIHGWPSIDLVGIKGSDAAIVIVQQAKPSMQESLLPILEQEFKNGRLSGQKLASIIDIMLIKTGKKQRYGTQLAIVNGEIVFNDIEDEKNLEQRRLAMSMLPMAQYKILLKRMYQLD